MEAMQPIEGITPNVLWITLYGIVCLCALIILADKVRGVFAGISDRKQKKKPELADEISSKVLEKLEPRLAEVDRKLANDKALLDSHTRQIDSLNRRADNQDTGLRALCHGMLALLDEAEKNGNGSQEITDAKKSFTNYLADK